MRASQKALKRRKPRRTRRARRRAFLFLCVLRGSRLFRLFATASKECRKSINKKEHPLLSVEIFSGVHVWCTGCRPRHHPSPAASQHAGNDHSAVSSDHQPHEVVHAALLSVLAMGMVYGLLRCYGEGIGQQMSILKIFLLLRILSRQKQSNGGGKRTENQMIARTNRWTKFPLS